MPTAWRIVKKRHAESAFDGEGARRYGGRWNSPGTSVVYASETRALSLLEVLIGIRSVKAVQAYLLIPVDFADSLVDSVDVDRLPEDWRRSPPHSAAQHIGDEWVEQETSAILRVPGVVVPEESNYLLNPAHPDFGSVEVGSPRELAIDPRLLR